MEFSTAGIPGSLLEDILYFLYPITWFCSSINVG